MFRTLFVRAVAACAVVAGMAQFAPAGIITSFSLPSGPAVPVSTPAPNNDNTVTASPNVIDLPVAAGTLLVFDNLNRVDISFAYVPSGGTTEYFVRESVVNNSGVDWVGYRLFFNFSFPVNQIGPVTFDFPSVDPAPFSSAFATVSMPLQFSNGILPAGGVMELTFSIDSLDIQQAGAFPLSQVPIAISEPPTFVLIGSLALTLVALLRRAARCAPCGTW